METAAEALGILGQSRRDGTTNIASFGIDRSAHLVYPEALLRQFDLSEYEVFRSPGLIQRSDYFVSYGTGKLEGIPDGYQWIGFVRKDNPRRIIAFETPLPDLARWAVLQGPVLEYSPSGAPIARKMRLKEILDERGISAKEWMSA